MNALARQWQATFDALGDSIALFDPQGVLERCNPAFARLASEPPAALVGYSWQALRPKLRLPTELESLIRTLHTRQTQTAEWTSAGRSWHAVADPVFDDQRRPLGTILTLRDVTEQRRAERAETTARSQAVRIEHLERELLALKQLAAMPPAAVTAQLFGTASLREVAAPTFEELVGFYTSLLDLALEQRDYKVQHPLSDRLRTLGTRLGLLNAGPRDVVEIVSTALERQRARAVTSRFQAYVEESRLLILELMGHLVSHYRIYSLGYRARPGVNATGQEEPP